LPTLSFTGHSSTSLWARVLALGHVGLQQLIDQLLRLTTRSLVVVTFHAVDRVRQQEASHTRSP